MIRQQNNILLRLFWSLIILLSGYFISCRPVSLSGGRDWRNLLEQAVLVCIPFNNSICTTGTGAFQFWSWFRKRHIRWHRMLGKIYIVGSLLGGLTALYLGFMQPYQGSIVPVILLALLWLFCTTAAWLTILRKNVQAHRLFMIRSYVLALTFISLRILSDMVEHWNILFFIDHPDMKDTTYEWLSWVLPLLVTELFISWIPSMKMSQQTKARAVIKA